MPASTHQDARRVPGWERVLNAFMADADRTLTNVQLADIPGVQAFHQRLTDLHRYGYVLTPAVKLQPGRYAYTLVGVGAHGAWPFGGPRPYADDLPTLTAEQQDVARATASTAIKGRADVLLKRERAPIRPVRSVVAQTRAMREAAAILATTLGDDVVGGWSADDRTDVLALAREAREEIGRARSLRSLEAEVATMRDARDDADAESSRGEADLLLVHEALADPEVPVNAEGIAEAIRRLRATPAPRRASVPRADRGPTGPTLMRKALEHHEQPMHTAKIAEWVLANGGADVYKGATPSATMAAQLATSNKTGGEFVKTSPGCYGLREWASKDDGGSHGDARRDGFGNELLELDPIR